MKPNYPKINSYNTPLILMMLCCLFSCHSTEEKTDSAYEDAKESQVFTDDSLEMDTPETVIPVAEVKKILVVDRWVKYSREIEMEFNSGEEKIMALKTTHGSDVKRFKRILSLEKEYQELRSRMDRFNRETEERLEKFKSELKSDIRQLESELKELSNEDEPD